MAQQQLSALPLIDSTTQNVVVVYSRFDVTVLPCAGRPRRVSNLALGEILTPRITTVDAQWTGLTRIHSQRLSSPLPCQAYIALGECERALVWQCYYQGPGCVLFTRCAACCSGGREKSSDDASPVISYICHNEYNIYDVYDSFRPHGNRSIIPKYISIFL